MAEVFNWQLGRPMGYPHEERHPKWQFAFVFNPNRCIGCQTCTMACKSTWTFSKGQELMWWNNVESKPYGGYPQHWDAKLLGMLEETNPGGQVWNTTEKEPNAKPYGTFQGKTIFEAAEKNVGPDGPQRALGYLPTDEEWRSPNIHEDTPAGDLFKKDSQYGGSVTLPEHKVWFFHLARICNHCTYPGCLASCPRNAIYKRPEDGIVLIDQSRCRGYRKCVEGCPYKKAMYRPTTGTSEKCVGCYPRIEGKDPTISPTGAPAETRCMAVCVGKIRLQGLVKINEDGQWAKDPTNPLYYLIRERQVALPLYPQFGTEPNGFYIPPRWVPRGYLHQMFGPGVEHAIEQYTCPDRELLAVLQLFRASQQIIFRFQIVPGPKVAEVEVTMPDGTTKVQEIFNDTVLGFNKFDEEVVRVTVEEPTFERPSEQHVNSI
jgi:nitrate reductase beta subunit